MAAPECQDGTKTGINVDVEAKAAESKTSDSVGSRGFTQEIPRYRTIREKIPPLRYLGRLENWLERLANVETQGIDRIPDEERKPPSLLNAFLMWFSFNGHIASVPVGLLGPEFGLSLQLSMAAIVIGVLLGSFFTAYCATLGPKLGLRAIGIARYSFGFWGAKLCAVINILLNVGFGVVAVVFSGQLLTAVSNYTMTVSVGCVIICVVAYVVSIFGFGIIHTFEKYAWIAAFVLACVLTGQAAPKMDVNAPSSYEGLPLAASFLTFLAINFAYAAAWCSVVSDYYCNYLSTTPAWKIFSVTYAGVTIPTVFILAVGACVGNAAFSYEPWGETYEENGLGGLIGAIYQPHGWSEFALVICTFTVLGTVIAANYSVGLAAQLLGDHFHAVPRLVWSFVAMVACLLLGVIGNSSLSLIIQNFTSMLGYWSVCFAVIVFLEDKWFRRHSGYDLDAWDNPKALPIGAAAVLTLVIGYCAGGVPGMDQTWFVGPIAAAFGGIGGDVGIYLAFVISIIVYLPLRTLEIRLTGR
ncbi:hypothetical protein GQ53DRAFT_647181 [Thozetella sp. PMI_491]|nr:hypothetical protein GQ53DRAFT_647181 [Thozetella sp. PMI_491]